MPFGLSVAASFLDQLHEPSAPKSSEITVEEVVRRVFERGGQVINNELRSLVTDMYNLYTTLNLTLETI